jgi:hypothetical protein
MSWAVLVLASGGKPDWLSSAELVRARRYAKRPLVQWPRLLAGRAEVRQVRMLAGVLRRVRSTPEISVGGIEAAVAHGSNLIAPADAKIDLYLSAEASKQLRGIRAIRWDAEEPNVTLRILPDMPSSAIAAVLGAPVVPAAVAAADLLDQGDERAVLAATELMR